MPRARVEMRDLPRGPLRDFTETLNRLYLDAGKPSLRTVSGWAESIPPQTDFVSHASVASLLRGDSSSPTWSKVELLVRALAQKNTSLYSIDEQVALVRDLWQSLVQPEKVPKRNLELIIFDSSQHFAQLAYDWGNSRPDTENKHMQGAVAISLINPDQMSFPEVFDVDFQKRVALLQEHKIMRRDGHVFGTKRVRGHTSFQVWGKIEHAVMVPSLISVETHLNGTVAIYFREDTDEAALDELVGWWVWGAWEMIQEIHDELRLPKVRAHVHVIASQGGLSDLKKPSTYDGPRPTIHFSTGPIALSPVRDRTGMRTESANQTALDWMGKIRAGLAAEADPNDDRAKSSDWTVFEVRNSLAMGRPIRTFRDRFWTR
jgi:hypothetical protein